MQLSQIARSEHDATFTEVSKEERLRQYAKFARNYDEHGKAGRYRAPDIVNERLLQSICRHSSGNNNGVLRLLDAACGTGLGSDKLRQFSDDPSTPWRLHLIGVDFSPDMLQQARLRGTYDELFEADLTEPVHLPGGPVDLLVCSGGFVEGHFKPKDLENILMILRPGGIASISFRTSYFESFAEQFKSAIDVADCDLISNDKLGYARDDLFGNYILAKKRGNHV